MRKLVNVVTVGLLVCPLFLGSLNTLANSEGAPNLVSEQVVPVAEETETSDSAAKVQTTETSSPEPEKPVKPVETPNTDTKDQAKPAEDPTPEPDAQVKPTETPSTESDTTQVKPTEKPDQEANAQVPSTETVSPESEAQKPAEPEPVQEEQPISVEEVEEIVPKAVTSDAEHKPITLGIIRIWNSIESDISRIAYNWTFSERVENVGLADELNDLIKKYDAIIEGLLEISRTNPYEEIEKIEAYCRDNLDSLKSLRKEFYDFVDKVNRILPVETVTYVISCVDEDDNPIFGVPDIIKTTNKGTIVTEKAPEIEGYFVVYDYTDHTQTEIIEDDTHVFRFIYSNKVKSTGHFNETVGPITAKVGETKTYQYYRVSHFNDGTMTEGLVNIEDTDFHLNSSDPSDIINGGRVTFGSEGVRTLGTFSGKSLQVTVTKGDVVDPTKIDKSGLEQAIKNGEAKIAEGGWEDDGWLTATIEHAKKINNDNHVTQTQVDAIIENISTAINALEKAGTGGETKVDKSGLEVAIKNGEAKIAEGGWKDVTKLTAAIENAKTVNSDTNATQAQVDEAVAGINAAITALEKADTGGGTNTGGNGTGNGAGGNNQNTNNKQTGNNNKNKVSLTSKKSSKSSKKNLPKTGEESNIVATLAGLSLVGLSAVVWFKRKA